MIPHIHALFEYISTPYENQHQTLNTKKKLTGAKSGFESIQLRYCNPRAEGVPTSRQRDEDQYTITSEDFWTIHVI